MRRLVAGASALCCISVAFLALAVGAGPARATGWQDLDERIVELEQTTVRAGGRRLTSNDPTIAGSECEPPGGAFDPAQSTTRRPAVSWQGFVIGARIQF
jgi:hypothetical protein